MVKITVEHNGKVMQAEGELFLGQVSSSDGHKTSADLMIAGTGASLSITQALEKMSIAVIKDVFEDPIEVCGNLIELQEGIDHAIKEYMKENADDLTDNIREFLAGEGAR